MVNLFRLGLNASVELGGLVVPTSETSSGLFHGCACARSICAIISVLGHMKRIEVLSDNISGCRICYDRSVSNGWCVLTYG